MRILLTGSTGYIGSAIDARLRARGHRVRLLVRPRSGGRDRTRDPAFAGRDVVWGDVLDPPACLRAADGCGAVVHAVGIIREYPRLGVTYDALHVEAARHLVRAARLAGADRFVLVGALGARPDAPSAYHRTKFAAERLVRASGLRWTIFRPSIVFHPGDAFSREVVDLIHRPLLPMIDGGRALMQPVSRGDLVEAIAASVTMPGTRGKVFEVGGPDRIAFGEIVEAFASRLKVWPNRVDVSARLVRPVVRLLERFPAFPLTADQLEMLREDNVCDPEPFRRAFGFETLRGYRDALPGLVDAVDPARRPAGDAPGPA